MKFNYDTVADVAYPNLNKGKIAKTIEVRNDVVVDIGRNGIILGIEILNFSAQQNIAKLTKIVKEGFPIQITSGTPVMV
jgi:uncharacterized protein YuzE